MTYYVIIKMQDISYFNNDFLKWKIMFNKHGDKN